MNCESFERGHCQYRAVGPGALKRGFVFGMMPVPAASLAHAVNAAIRRQIHLAITRLYSEGLGQ